MPKKSLIPETRNIGNQSKVKARKVIRLRATRMRDRLYENQEAMVAEMQTSENTAKILSWADEMDAEDAKKIGGSTEKTDFDKLLEGMDKLRDQVKGAEDDELGDFSENELDILINEADLDANQVIFGTMEPTKLDCMVMTLPQEFGANHTLAPQTEGI